jgi:hypothetical protein
MTEMHSKRLIYYSTVFDPLFSSAFFMTTMREADILVPWVPVASFFQ